MRIPLPRLVCFACRSMRFVILGLLLGQSLSRIRPLWTQRENDTDKSKWFENSNKWTTSSGNCWIQTSLRLNWIRFIGQLFYSTSDYVTIFLDGLENQMHYINMSINSMWSVRVRLEWTTKYIEINEFIHWIGWISGIFCHHCLSSIYLMYFRHGLRAIHIHKFNMCNGRLSDTI